MIDLSIYVELMQILFTTSSAAFWAHRAALLADPSCQQALLNVLLHRVLPSLAAALEAAHMCNSIESGNIDSSGDGGASAVAVDSRRAFTVLCALPALLIAASGSPADRPPSKALRSRVCQLGGAGLVQHAARIIQALPLTRPEDMETEVFIQSQTAALHLLELTAVSMADVAADGGPPSASEQGGSSGSGSAAAVVSASPEEQQEAAWHVVRLVPHLAELVRSLAADASFPANAMAIICIGFSRAGLAGCRCWTHSTSTLKWPATTWPTGQHRRKAAHRGQLQAAGERADPWGHTSAFLDIQLCVCVLPCAAQSWE